MEALLAKVDAQASEIKQLKEKLLLTEERVDDHDIEIYHLMEKTDKIDERVDTVEGIPEKIDELERRMPDHYHG